MGADLNALRAVAENPEADGDLQFTETILAVVEDLDARLTAIEARLEGPSSQSS
ncbi:hypothetical protein [Bogoriella caseilytica]|uniref:Uncharacterized protein n=1 Tax=Bogoriella caseilytica TaxID=56055 RepID=A0A3N2BA41_9MICO|nr:hypothetical protein [Bogoriella caseilytica]ROR72117.1 hypothetical protein EDD31_0464 [Bogoriella caseilytica]